MKLKYFAYPLFAISLCLIGTNSNGAPSFKKSSPLNLEWGVKSTDNPTGRPIIQSYVYMYGEPAYGKIRYVGKEPVFDMSNEIILYFVESRLSSAMLILGPDGLGEYNCVKKYKEVIKGLSRKYGHHKHSEKETDPLIYDLIFVNKCHAVKLGLEFISHKWVTKDFRIQSFLYGDEETIFIEIEYYYLFLAKKEKEKEIQKSIEKL